MKTNAPLTRLALAAMSGLLLLSACAPGTAGVAATQTPPPVSNTESLPLTSEPSALPTLPPTPIEAPTPAPVAEVRGIMVFAPASDKRTQNQFVAYNLNGDILYELPAGSFPEYGSAQVFGDAVYDLSTPDSALIRVDQQGEHKISLGNGNFSGSLVISRDGQRIAWAWNDMQSQPGTTEVWIADADGSEAHKAVFSPLSQPDSSYLLAPFRWTADGKLVYTVNMWGIGGYILFNGYDGFRLYDPETGRSTALTPEDQHFGLCLDNLSPDLSKVLLHCNGQGGQAQIIVQERASGASLNFPPLADQGQAGTMWLSPSGQWLAYAIARGNPDREYGQVIVAPADGSATPKSIAAFEGGYYQVLGWADEETLVISRFESNQTSVWRVGRDGSGLTKLADGRVIGLMR